MQVELSDLKQELNRVKVVLSTGSIDGADGHVMFQFKGNRLRLGGRGVALSYTGLLSALDEDNQVNKRVYVPVKLLPLFTDISKSDTTIDLRLDGLDLHYETETSQGVIQVESGMKHWKPYMSVQGDPYLLLANGKNLADKIRFVSEVKKGWTVKTRPYAGGFIRLAVYDESAHPDLHQPDVDVYRLLLDKVSPDQDQAVGYASGVALSVFASDEARYFQAFEPAYARPATEQGDNVPTTTILNPGLIGTPIHLLLANADALRKVLPGETLRMHLLRDEKQRVKALTLFNASCFIWVEVALHTYPDEDFNQQISHMNGTQLASFHATSAFKKTVSTVAKLQSTKQHGLTFRVKDGSIYVSSPESSAAVSYGSVNAKTNQEKTYIVDINGVKSALTQMKGEIVVVGGVDFLVLYNSKTLTRVILRNFNQE
jgi:hypothetical protein